MTDSRKTIEQEQKLQASENRFRTIILRNADAIVIVDQMGVIRFVNPAAESLFGLSHETMIGMVFGFPIAGDDKAELDIVQKDGRTLVAEMRVVETEWEDSKAYLASLRDITRRKQAERLEQDRNKVLELVAQNKPLEIVLEQITCLVERQCPGVWCSVLLLRDGYLHFQAGSGVPEEYVRTFQKIAVAPDACPCGQAVFFKQPVFRERIDGDAWCHVCQNTWFHEDQRACYAIPMFLEEQDISGVLVMYYPHANDLTEEGRTIASVASYLAGIAVKQQLLTNRLLHQAHHDSLTGLPNRLFFEERLHQTLADMQRTSESVAVCFIDLDRFKQINDTLGHAVGDILLQQVAQRFVSEVRVEDTLARMGGDEFMLLMRDIHDIQRAALVAQRLIDMLDKPFQIDGHELYVSASIGISMAPKDAQDAVTLQRNADMAMYQAKEHGGHMFRCFNIHDNAPALERLKLETQLRHALERNELLLHYQPQVDKAGKLVGVEALLRWNHPEYGMLLPDRFVSLAEESGLMVHIGTWVLQEACRQIQAWRAAGYPLFKVSVNISSHQFAQANFVESVMQALQPAAEHGHPLLDIEITEQVMMMDDQQVLQKMARLQEIGVGIAIDDFGTGCSSLLSLQRLPVNTLKIAPVFVQNIAGLPSPVPANDAAIVGVIAFLAYSLGLQIVAEGVETEAQFTFLCDAGCSGAQGKLFSSPLPPEEIELLLQRSMNGKHPRIFSPPDVYYDTMI
jgi:diguanylate cyclase (GGDEF)-like protein